MRVTSILFFGFLASVHGVRIDVDTSRAPDLSGFGRRVKATLEDYYPRAWWLLGSGRHVDRISISFDPNYHGVAYAAGNRIVGSVNYYRHNQHDVGSMIHEMAHVIQGYRPGCPGWITEGLADWVRYFHFEPNRKPGKPGWHNHYTEGYGVAAYFLNWIESRYKMMLYYINKDCREGTYRDNIFPRLTRKSVGQHWKDMLRS